MYRLALKDQFASGNKVRAWNILIEQESFPLSIENVNRYLFIFFKLSYLLFLLYCNLYNENY